MKNQSKIQYRTFQLRGRRGRNIGSAAVKRHIKWRSRILEENSLRRYLEKNIKSLHDIEGFPAETTGSLRNEFYLRVSISRLAKLGLFGEHTEHEVIVDAKYLRYLYCIFLTVC